MAVAIVTGSDSGIGRATAVRLAVDGFDIGVTWHEDELSAKETAAEVEQQGRRAEMRRLDLSGLPTAADVIDELAVALGGVDYWSITGVRATTQRCSNSRMKNGATLLRLTSTVPFSVHNVPHGG